MTYPLGEDPLDGKPCEKCPDYATNCAVGCDREGDCHDSDCATHDAPAYPKGAGDCSAQDMQRNAFAHGFLTALRKLGESDGY